MTVHRLIKVTGGTSYKRIVFFSRNSKGTKCDCKCGWLWVQSLLEENRYLFKFIFSFLRSGAEAKSEYVKNIFMHL